MPRLNAAHSLQRQLEKNRRFSLDVLCRFLVSPSYRNVMQSTNVFMVENSTLLEEAQTRNPSTGRIVHAAKLRKNVLGGWARLCKREQDLHINHITALLEGDIELGNTLEILQIDVEPEVTIPAEPASPLPQQFSYHTGDRRACLIKKLAHWIQEDMFQPHYRKRPYGPTVSGWDQRLRSYFWPKPEVGYEDTVDLLTPWQDALCCLAKKLEDGKEWNIVEMDQAVELAWEIFTWGGVPQTDVTTDKIKKVILNAIYGSPIENDAPMNSGWTKVASLATQHLESYKDRHPQVIWDSRVSTSIIYRMDRIIGINQFIVNNFFPELGIVNGRGGSRPRHTTNKWPIGYGKWSAQFAGSSIIREIRDILNNSNEQYPTMPLPADGSGPWTTRGVEMVLFGDGY